MWDSDFRNLLKLPRSSKPDSTLTVPPKKEKQKQKQKGSFFSRFTSSRSQPISREGTPDPGPSSIIQKEQPGGSNAESTDRPVNLTVSLIHDEESALENGGFTIDMQQSATAVGRSVLSDGPFVTQNSNKCSNSASSTTPSTTDTNSSARSSAIGVSDHVPPPGTMHGITKLGCGRHFLNISTKYLPRSHGAEYDTITNTTRSPCAPGTRIPILDELICWCESDHVPFYWMDGMAGTGKMTIMYTLCQKLDRENLLGASFFCSRSLPDCRNVDIIIPTLAFQLAQRYPPFAEALAEALHKDPNIIQHGLDAQLRKFIIEPWTMRKGQLPSCMVVVIHALDECGQGHYALLRALFDCVSKLPFKVLVTSRSDSSIRDIMTEKARVPGTLSTFVLHGVESDLVQDDIVKYLTSQLPDDVAPDDIQFLASLAGTLFIVAATLVRFLAATRSSITIRIEMLRALLRSNTKTTTILLLDELYKEILGMAFHSTLSEMEAQQMEKILLTVLYAREPLTRKAIASLWNLTEEDVAKQLDALRSVISVPDDCKQPITVFHGSFPDFLEDPMRAIRFYCEPRAAHLEIVQRCLELMERELYHNLCQLKGRPPNDSICLDSIYEYIGSGLRYSSVYWPEHSTLSGSAEISSSIHRFLSTRLLHWSECLSLTRRLPVGVQSLEPLLDTLAENPALASLVHNCLRFIQQVYDVAEYSAMETYHCALTWIPLHSTLRTHYSSLCEQAPQVLCGLAATWTGPDQTINIHSDDINSIGISHDGRLITSGSQDSVRLWNMHSHIEECVFRDHTKSINSVAIFRDERRAVSGSNDGTMRVWNTATHEVAFILESGRAVLAVAISPDDKWVASGHPDGLVCVWTATDRHLAHSLKGHTGDVHAVSFTHDGTWLVSTSFDETARVWDVMKKTARVLSGHKGAVTSVACSPNDNKVVTGSCDKTARLWDMSDGELLVFHGHSESVNSVAFIPDGKKVVTGSHDRTIRIWDVTSGETIHVLMGLAAGVRSVAVFPDGLKIASCSGHTISIWSLRGGSFISGEEKKLEVPSPSMEASSMAFSVNGERVLLLPSLRIIGTETLEEKLDLGSEGVTYGGGTWSTSGNKVAAFAEDSDRIGMIKIWELTDDGIAPNCPFNFKGHTNKINSVSFSHDECKLVSSSNDKTVRLWNLITRKPFRLKFKHEDLVCSAAFSHDDTQIVSATAKSICLWHAQSGDQLHSFEVDRTPFPAVFHPDNQHIITSYNWTITIYNAKTSQLEYTHKGYKYWTTMNDGSSYALSSDGWICHFPHFNQPPSRSFWVPSQYHPSIGTNNSPLFTSTSRGIQVCLPRLDGLATLLIPGKP